MNRAAAVLVGVTVVAGLGGSVLSRAVPIWVKTLTGSDSLAALAGFAVFVPTLAGPLIGAVVDRLPARRILVATNLAVAFAVLTLAPVADRPALGQIYAVMVAYGLGLVVVDAAEARVMVDALSADGRGRLNGARLSIQEGMKLVAPLLGAGLFVWAGAGAVAGLSAGTLVAAAGLCCLLRPAAAAAADRANRPLWTHTREGLRLLWSRRRLRLPVVVAATAMLASGLGNASIFAVVDRALHEPPALVGVLSCAQGAGAIAGGFLAGRLLSRLAETGLALLGAAVFALGVLVQAIGWLPAVLAGSLAVGVGLPWSVVAAFTAVQRHAPAEQVGAITGSATTVVFVAPAIGIPAGALLVSIVDYRLPLLLGACACLTQVAVLIPRRRARAEDRVESVLRP